MRRSGLSPGAAAGKERPSVLVATAACRAVPRSECAQASSTDRLASCYRRKRAPASKAAASPWFLGAWVS
jgi:hypothetical protein